MPLLHLSQTLPPDMRYLDQKLKKRHPRVAPSKKYPIHFTYRKHAKCIFHGIDQGPQTVASTSDLKATGSFMAISARVLRSSSRPALCTRPINWE